MDDNTDEKITRRSWLRKDDKQLIDLVNDRVRPSRISKILDRTERSIYNRIALLKEAEPAAFKRKTPKRVLVPVSDQGAGYRKPINLVAPVSQRARRTCLCCGKTFMSTGPENRLCKYCRKLDHKAEYMGKAPVETKLKKITITLFEVAPFSDAPWAQHLAQYLPKFAWRVEGSNGVNQVGATGGSEKHAISEAQKAARRITGDVRLDAHLRQYRIGNGNGKRARKKGRKAA